MMAGFNHFSEIAAHLKPALQEGIKKTAQRVQDNAAARAPVDTGFLRASIYTSTPDSSTYGQGGGPTKPGGSLLPEEKPADDLTAIVGVGASYGVYNEMGTSRMAPRPYLTPGAEAARGDFEDIMAKAILEGLLSL